MEKNEKELVAAIGKEKYDEEIKMLQDMEKQEAKLGKFEAISGDVDTRDKSKHDIVLSEGFEQTQCGLKGSKLSGGQKQRVAIARTIIRQPKVLLLDEATSALDETSQAKVSKALVEAMKGRTTIVIAHRLSTIERCDKIFVLDNGKVIEEGTFTDLKKAEGGHFSK
jgi:ATP-binding cassette subfamily B (MDR/TAP) protein 1